MDFLIRQRVPVYCSPLPLVVARSSVTGSESGSAVSAISAIFEGAAIHPAPPSSQRLSLSPRKNRKSCSCLRFCPH
jgi:hypothetical protein